MKHRHDHPVFMVDSGSAADALAAVSSLGSRCCALPSDAAEAAKAALRFPCEFTVKAIGLQADDLVEHTHALIVKHDPELKLEHITVRPSSKGKYISISAAVKAVSREQLDAIYQELTDDPRILYTL